jgi:hypothetical protein
LDSQASTTESKVSLFSTRSIWSMFTPDLSNLAGVPACPGDDVDMVLLRRLYVLVEEREGRGRRGSPRHQGWSIRQCSGFVHPAPWGQQIWRFSQWKGTHVA